MFPFDLHQSTEIIAAQKLTMTKLVILSEGMTGRTHELTVDKTTVGRVEDNTLQISEASVSSHHAEILLRGSDVVVKDLNSTNGTFINGEQISGEATLKPGQILRLGKIEIRLETAASAAASAAKKPAESTMIMQRGVSLTDLEQGARSSGFDTAGKGFAKKSNQVNKWFLIGGIIIGVVILGVLVYAFLVAGKSGPGQ
jgi:pSer/pThr/pTyr-binding forkhead associated (FHA) protein